ncbi:MAG: BlaI/MecI/CopY family transcriptional regulator [Ruminococcaceae bacterium]|nr:BlaI/MecI/CopY family transcriptional regulator [Oscillospiraceae bacterium]MBD5116434.1 BlaI/MecI/CopY family transcriptional regulator [Oscillospiraceae bacterium]
MKNTKLGTIESKFADMIWNNEPISTASLVKLCEKELDWKRTTTYTVLKRLSERGLFQNENGTVTSLVSRNDFYSMKTESFVNETFGGSLPAFLAAFASRKKLNKEEIDEIRNLIDNYGKETEK